MESSRENIAQENVILQTASENDWMQREAKYQVTMRIMKKWLENGLIVTKEYGLAKQKFKEKYRPIIGDLLLEKAG